MKLKNKIYLIQFFILFSLILFLSLLYYTYQEKNDKDLYNNTKRIVENHKYHIEKSLKNIYKEYNSNQKVFYKIHSFTQNEYIKNPNIDLKILKKHIKNEFQILDMDIDLYLIDKTYTITNSTYKKDIGFNLNVIEDAKLYLDKTKKDSKIHVASNISIDMLDSNLNVYSYSKINEDLYFEMGFKFKNPIYTELKKDLENIYKKTGDKITLFRVIDTADKKEFYDNILKDISTVKISKKEYESRLKKFDKDKPTDDKHINAIRFNQMMSNLEENTLTIYIPLLSKNKSELLFYNNLLMTIKIDISEQLQIEKETKLIFVYFVFGLILLLGILYYFIKYNFYKPMMKVTKSMELETKITDKILLDKKDEFGILVKKYNTLFDKLSNEINLNSALLKENKRFIADTVHQIRTPLTNIMMNGEMVKKFQKDDSLSSFIDKIDSSINMLSNSYEDLAYVTTSDTIEYPPTNVNISEMIKNRIKFFTTISKVNKKEILPNIINDITIYINQIELERIIDNNISNAIKYATKNKAITITLSNNSDKTVSISFLTFGEPIKNKEKIFEKNYRENEAKRGLGLGLNMVKNICDKYDITYTVSYKNGQNIFTYTFKGIN